MVLFITNVNNLRHAIILCNNDELLHAADDVFVLFLLRWLVMLMMIPYCKFYRLWCAVSVHIEDDCWFGCIDKYGYDEALYDRYADTASVAH